MDKRTLLALALVAIVIIVTPRLFPSSLGTAPEQNVGAGRPDSANASGTTAGTAGERAAITSAVPNIVAPRVQGAVEAADSGKSPEASLIAAETVDIAGTTATLQLTNQGGSPLRMQLPGYRALDKLNPHVIITAGSTPLLQYRILGPQDTVALAKVAFAVERSTTSNGESVVTFRGSADGRPVEIRYVVVADSFVARVTGSIGRDSGGSEARFLLIDLPKTFQSFEADSADDQNHFAYAAKPRTRNAEGIPFGSLDPGERQVVQGPLAWVAAKSKYFIVGLLARDGDDTFLETTVVGGTRVTRTATVANGTVVKQLGPDGAFAFDLYIGPQQYKRLQAMGREFENSNPYGGFMQGVVQPFATLVMKILLWMRDTLKLDYGWLLVIFGIAVRLILWPLNHGAMRTSMKMQRIQPELNDVQKRYKADPQKMQAEMMRVYKEHDMSPFSTFAGCLPLLLPMPVLFALFFVFQNTIEFRGVPFLWLADISLKDPFYIVPLLMGVSMFVLSWVGMRNSPPNPQAKMMLYVFPVMMTFLFANFASGLNLYYAIQNVAALPQQWLIANERGKQGTGKKT